MADQSARIRHPNGRKRQVWHLAVRLIDLDAARLDLFVEALQIFDLEAKVIDWQTLPVLPKNLEQAVCSRFDAALTALERCDRLYAEMLENNRGILSQELLRAEIVSGIDSPSELSRERLQLQVEVLQASLKAGQKALTHETQLLRVLALPAHIDDRIADRIERVIAGSFKNI